MKTPSDYIAIAQAAFDAGFLSMAAKKRAQEILNRAYTAIRDEIHTAQIKVANADPATNQHGHERGAFFERNALPFDLHQVRDRHFDIAANFGAGFMIVRDLLALRASIKDAPLAPAPVKPEIEVKAEAVRRTIMEEMERRKALYIDGLEMARHFGRLPVSVNAHWVHGHKGAQFIRHFFYLAGKLTPLNTILAIADTLEREEAAR